MKYRVCPDCGAHLDPGEICEECRKKEAALLAQKRPQENIPTESITSSENLVKEGDND